MLAALVLFSLPTICHADVGDLGRVAVVAIGIFLALWGGLSVGVFLLSRRRWAGWRALALASLFFVSPALLIVLILFKGYALGEYPAEVTEATSQPLAVAGITFPIGSRVRYEQTGGVFGWHARRKLLDIHSPHPLSLGGIRIDGLQLHQFSADVSIYLSGDQTIEGWSCAATFDPVMSRAPSGFALQSCQLAVPHIWRGEVIPAGTFVSRDGADWMFLQ
jgi:hypothetical protein